EGRPEPERRGTVSAMSEPEAATSPPRPGGDAKAVATGLRVRALEDGRIEEWSLDNPARRNAVTPEALRWITARAVELRGEVVLLRGHEGPFCSGFDLIALREAIESGDAMESSDFEISSPPDQPLMT